MCFQIGHSLRGPNGDVSIQKRRKKQLAKKDMKWRHGCWSLWRSLIVKGQGKETSKDVRFQELSTLCRLWWRNWHWGRHRKLQLHKEDWTATLREPERAYDGIKNAFFGKQKEEDDRMGIKIIDKSVEVEGMLWRLGWRYQEAWVHSWLAVLMLGFLCCGDSL